MQQAGASVGCFLLAEPDLEYDKLLVVCAWKELWIAWVNNWMPQISKHSQDPPGLNTESCWWGHYRHAQELTLLMSKLTSDPLNVLCSIRFLVGKISKWQQCDPFLAVHYASSQCWQSKHRLAKKSIHQVLGLLDQHSAAARQLAVYKLSCKHDHQARLHLHRIPQSSWGGRLARHVPVTGGDAVVDSVRHL